MVLGDRAIKWGKKVKQIKGKEKDQGWAGPGILFDNVAMIDRKRSTKEHTIRWEQVQCPHTRVLY